MQILHINSNHWITNTNADCADSEVCVYDSLYKYVSLDIKKTSMFVFETTPQNPHNKCDEYAKTARYLFMRFVCNCSCHYPSTWLESKQVKVGCNENEGASATCTGGSKLTNFPVESERKVCPSCQNCRSSYFVLAECQLIPDEQYLSVLLKVATVCSFTTLNAAKSVPMILLSRITVGLAQCVLPSIVNNAREVFCTL